MRFDPSLTSALTVLCGPLKFCCFKVDSSSVVALPQLRTLAAPLARQCPKGVT